MRLTKRMLCLPFWPQRVLGITRVTVWDITRSKYPDLDEGQFYDKMMTLELGQHPDIIHIDHELQLNCETQFKEIMQKFGCNFRMIRNLTEVTDDVEWADLVISIGGDGTFLRASQLIKDNKKPLIGINPKCLTGKPTFSVEHCSEVEKVFQKLHKGRYNLLMRRRIRTVMYGEGVHSEPYHVEEKAKSVKDIMEENKNDKKLDNVTQSTERKVADAPQPRRRVLPWLALNEVYMGEFVSTGAITFTIQVNDQENQYYKFQCSGICVCTGSGSRSWFRSMNLQAPETVKRLVKMAVGKDIDEEKALCVMRSYHRSLIFDPEDDRMAYMVREMYRARRWPKPKSSPERGMCRSVEIMSHGFDAGLVIDASVTLPFNNGTIAAFEIHPEDALKNFVVQ